MDFELSQDIVKIITRLRNEAYVDRVDSRDVRAFALEQVAEKLEIVLKQHGYCPEIRAPRGMGIAPMYSGMYICWNMSLV